ncbi:SMR family transporter, partial [Guyparkeria sp. SB14A]
MATNALKATDGFTRLGPSALAIAGYGGAFFCLALALRSIPVG